MATHSGTPALENPKDSGAWRTSVHGVAKSRRRLKNLECTHAQNEAQSAMKEEHAYKMLWEQRWRAPEFTLEGSDLASGGRDAKVQRISSRNLKGFAGIPRLPYLILFNPLDISPLLPT